MGLAQRTSRKKKITKSGAASAMARIKRELEVLLENSPSKNVIDKVWTQDAVHSLVKAMADLYDMPTWKITDEYARQYVEPRSDRSQNQRAPGEGPSNVIHLRKPKAD